MEILHLFSFRIVYMPPPTSYVGNKAHFSAFRRNPSFSITHTSTAICVAPQVELLQRWQLLLCKRHLPLYNFDANFHHAWVKNGEQRTIVTLFFENQQQNVPEGYALHPDIISGAVPYNT